MADTTTDHRDEPKRRPGVAGGAPAVADDGDVAFGGMVGIAVIAAVLVSMLALAGFFGYEAPDTAAPAVAAVATTEAEPDEAAEPDEDEAAEEELDEEAAPTTTETPTTTEAPVDAAAATVTASAGGIVLAGTVPSEDIATSLRAAAASQYPEDQIDDQLEVVEGADPFTLSVSGTLDDAAAFDGLTASFDALGLGTGLSNELTLSEGGAAVAELNDLFALEPIQFETGTATIIADSLPTLAAATEILLANPDLAVEVGGHTDSRGNDEGNLALSQLRADAVVAALQDGGVTNDLTAVGYGETDLKEDPDDTPEKQQANRRIEFKLL